FTSFSLKTSIAAFARSSVSDVIVTAWSPLQAIDVPVPRKSNRVDSSFAAWLRALSTSWRSTLLTTSNDGFAMPSSPPVGVCCEPPNRLSYAPLRATAYPGGLPERPMGADCKSVAKATEVRILYPPPAGSTAPDQRGAGKGPLVVP